jgi:hypothetical protein
VTVAGVTGAIGSTASKLNDPIAVFIDATGNLYVADQHNHRVQKFPAGSSSGTNAVTVAGGNGLGSAANQFQYANDMVVDAAGNLYVQDYMNSRTQKFPPGSTSSTNGVTVSTGAGLAHANRMSLDAYGNLFLSDELNHRIEKIQVSNTLANSYVATTPGTYMVVSTNSSGCSDTAIAYVICAATIYSNISASICQGSTYSFNGAMLTAAGVYKDTLSAVSGVDSIVTLTLTVNPTPSISISQSGSICNTGGDTLRVIGGTGSSISWIGNGTPIGGSSSFSTYTVAGGNGSGSGATQFKTPYGVQADAAGYIYVLDQGNNRIQNSLREVPRSPAARP